MGVPLCQANETELAAWPRFARAWAKRIELELTAGDGLLIPSWWWHCTVALDDNAAINWWFDDAESEMVEVLNTTNLPIGDALALLMAFPKLEDNFCNS